jgi:hypothetical protein
MLRKFVIAVAAAIPLLPSNPSHADMALTALEKQQEDRAYNFCMSQKNGTVINSMRSYSCYHDLMARLIAKWPNVTDAQVAACLHYSREVHFIVDKYVTLIRHSPMGQWAMILDMFMAELNRERSEWQDTIFPPRP